MNKPEEYIVCKTLLEAIDLIIISKGRLNKTSRAYYQKRIREIAEEMSYLVPNLDKNIREAKDIILELAK
jgi:hypothetical protein